MNRSTNELTSVDVLYSINTKTEPAGSLSPDVPTKVDYLTGSTISISNLLDFVNKYYPDILSENVLKHYNYDSRPDGKLGESVLYQSRSNLSYDRDLVAIHNLSAENLLKSINLGGFAMPSIAITKSKLQHNDYGKISLIFSKDTIDPGL